MRREAVRGGGEGAGAMVLMDGREGGGREWRCWEKRGVKRGREGGMGRERGMGWWVGRRGEEGKEEKRERGRKKERKKGGREKGILVEERVR